MIPKAIERELEKLVRDRDRWKRRAMDRAADRSPERARQIEARDRAVDLLFYAIDIEGLISKASRGARGAVWEAIEALRPDIATTPVNGLENDAGNARRRFFPSPDDE